MCAGLARTPTNTKEKMRAAAKITEIKQFTLAARARAKAKEKLPALAD
jgi:hypothetical protein